MNDNLILLLVSWQCNWLTSLVLETRNVIKMLSFFSSHDLFEYTQGVTVIYIRLSSELFYKNIFIFPL